MLNTDKRPIDGATEVPVGEAGKILKNSGYKISNNELDSFVSLKDINKIYPNGVQAVYDFNIDISENDFIVLVGDRYGTSITIYIEFQCWKLVEKFRIHLFYDRLKLVSFHTKLVNFLDD
jgi:hypothetical protein